MLKLSDYIGQILTDVAAGREIADRNSASLSERYQADGFMKGMPVPHYTIDEASFDLPFMIVGAITKGAMDDGLEEQILNSTRDRTENLLYNFLCDKLMKKQAENSGSSSTPGEIRKKFKSTVNSISASLTQTVQLSIEAEGLKIIKLLDLVDGCCSKLDETLAGSFEKYGDDNPFIEKDAVYDFITKLRRVLFNEYKDIISTTNGIIVDPSTGKLDEYAEDNCLTSLKLTLREQDLDFVIEKDDKTGTTKRFLSLN